jgi:predicted SAM-dependent methyltransferase
MRSRLYCIGFIKSIRSKLGSLIAFLRHTTERPRAFVRTKLAIRRLKRAVSANPSVRIVVGSSGIFTPGWIPTEIEYLNLLRPSDWQLFFSPGSLEAVLAEHVWEHLTPAEGATAAKICFDYLRPGGRLRLAIPDGFNPDPDYREWVRPGGTGAGANDHKVLYTHETLGRLLTEVGFKVELLEYFDIAGKFHFTDWDPADGMIHRSRRFDERNSNGRLGYTSLVVDAYKEVGSDS